MAIIDQIKIKMKIQGHNPSSLSRAAGISQGNAYAILGRNWSKTSNPTLHSLEAIAKALDSVIVLEDTPST